MFLLVTSASGAIGNGFGALLAFELEVVIFPSVIASASTNAGVPLVAILALCSIVSGATAISSLFVRTTKAKAGLARPRFVTCGLVRQTEPYIRETL